MTEILFNLNENTIFSFFERGKCLTFDPLEPMDAFEFSKKLKSDFQKKAHTNRVSILSKTAFLWPDSGYTPPFHFFSDGTLLHRFYYEEERKVGVKRIKDVLSALGYKITRTYGPRNVLDPEYDAFLRKISEIARQKYPFTDDLYATALPDTDTFVKQCFENKNELLTASKNENTPPKYRDILALFSDGRFFVSEEYKDIIGINDPLKIYDFKNDCRQKHFIFLKRTYVPKNYLNALYAKASEYDWYLPPGDALNGQNVKRRPSTEEIREMETFIDALTADRTCVSMTIPDPSDEFISPERENFVLFSDGTLILDMQKKGVEDIFCEHLRRPFPETEFNIRFVPDFYVPEIYKRLMKKQKSAQQIYLEMLKQKAKKLKKKLDIPHHEALELVSVMAGWPSWKTATTVEEEQARHVICAEQIKKKIAQNRGYGDPVEWEYHEYLKKKSNASDKKT